MKKTEHPLYNVWRSMRARCRNPKNAAYSYYGERGITVCERWENFWKFVEDMGSKPTSLHTLERKNVNAGYAPDNCCWATRSQQQLNRRDSVNITVKGVTKSIYEWARISQLNPRTILARLYLGWSAEEAVKLPRHPPHHNKGRYIEHNGETLKLNQWATKAGLNAATLAGRLNAGWEFAAAIAIPATHKNSARSSDAKRDSKGRYS